MHQSSYNLRSGRYRPYGHQPPLGLGYVAAIAEKAGHEVVIVDGVAKGYSIDDCARVINGLSPDMVGLSVMTHVKDESAALADSVRRMNPKVRIVVGGTHAYYFSADILREMPSVDFVLYGEVESSLQTFLANVGSPDKWHVVPGLFYRLADGTVASTPPPPAVESLDDVALPSWHLYDFNLYRPLPFQSKGGRFFALITSRGCAYAKCAFCYQSGNLKQRYRRHSPARVVLEMKTLHDKYGVRDIAFWDDTFSTDLKWLSEFARLLKEQSLSINWTCSTKVSFLNEERLSVMRDAGCWSIFLGIESGDEELLHSIEKGITLDQARNAVRWANELGIETRCAYMLGLPGETPEKARKTMALAKELDSTYAIFYATHPRYGTKLYEMATRTGTFLSKEFRGMTGITYVPEGYRDAEELRRTIRRAYTGFYLRPRQLLKYVRKMNSFSAFRELFFALELFLGLRR
jgi:radical SAM superfamily enzyme YgiQ (UPF0313 family)